MTISIWRFSHFVLALISSAFIILASVTGMVLAFEPISNQLQPYGFNHETTLATTLKSLSNHYDEIITVETDENNFVIASVITNEGESDTFYVNPETGEKLGALIEKAPVFRFATNLHRSLFLKSTGRFIVGLVSFFLILMALSGLILIVKRQGGIHRFFSKVVNENFEQYYHVILGRWLLIPIIIVALTGVYLSLEKFSLLPESNISHKYPEVVSAEEEKALITEFDVFKTLKIADVKRLEFPFSEDVEDYFFIKLKAKELLLNQYSGEIVSEQKYPIVQLMSQWSLLLHTGQGTILWSFILFLVCVALLFFIYSGFAMTIKRIKNTGIPKNKFTKDRSEIIILVGSETGSTFRFASVFYEALIAQGKTVFISELNAYTNYEQAKQLVIFTSTYGEGDAPVNATKFERLITTTTQNQVIDYAVLGFGSMLYPDYCKYAEDVDDLLKSNPSFNQSLELFKINNQSFEVFQTWVNVWSRISNVPLQIEPPKLVLKSNYTRTFKVIHRTDINTDQTFMLQLKPTKKVSFQSGDLLAFRPDVNQAARQYSIARLEEDVLLSIKKHKNGLCSTYLSKLQNNETISATVEHNQNFHLPKSSKAVVMIANGTGIAPFLGMILENKKQKNLHLFWGGRTKASFNLYKDDIDNAIAKKHLLSIAIAYSQEANQQYVQDLIKERYQFIANHLQNKGVIMICGSIAMQNQVLLQLEKITNNQLKTPLEHFNNNNQILSDCY